MSLALRLDAADPTPPFEQLRRQLATAIRAGALAAGTRLPTVRQLAGDLGVAPGTVMRAYRELEEAGLIETRRGSGTTVAPGQADAGALGIAALTDRFIADAVRAGADPGGIRRAVEAALVRLGPA